MDVQSFGLCRGRLTGKTWAPSSAALGNPAARCVSPTQLTVTSSSRSGAATPSSAALGRPAAVARPATAPPPSIRASSVRAAYARLRGPAAPGGAPARTKASSGAAAFAATNRGEGKFSHTSSISRRGTGLTCSPWRRQASAGCAARGRAAPAASARWPPTRPPTPRPGPRVSLGSAA